MKLNSMKIIDKVTGEDYTEVTILFLEGQITRKKYLSLTHQTSPRCKKNSPSAVVKKSPDKK